MSTILKALRRLEHAKTSQLQRPLREEVASGAEPRRRFPVFWVAAAVFTAGIGIGAAALFLWPGRVLDLAPGAETAPGAEPQAAAQPAAPAAAPPAGEQGRPATAASETRLQRQRQRLAGSRARGAAETARVAPPPIAQQPAEDIALLREIAPTPLRLSEAESDAGSPQAPAPGESRPGAEAMKPKPRPAAPPPSAVATVATARPRAPEPEPLAARPASTSPPVAKAAVPETSASERESAPLPERSFSSRDSEPVRPPVPVILVSRTQWHPNPERREALIEVERPDGAEKRRVREGDAIGSLVVERIEPSGVVFDYDGVELRHGVGSGQ